MLCESACGTPGGTTRRPAPLFPRSEGASPGLRTNTSDACPAHVYWQNEVDSLLFARTLTFLRGLKRHNDRAWFAAHKDGLRARRQGSDDRAGRAPRARPASFRAGPRGLAPRHRSTAFTGTRGSAPTSRRSRPRSARSSRTATCPGTRARASTRDRAGRRDDRRRHLHAAVGRTARAARAPGRQHRAIQLAGRVARVPARGRSRLRGVAPARCLAASRRTTRRPST